MPAHADLEQQRELPGDVMAPPAPRPWLAPCVDEARLEARMLDEHLDERGDGRPTDRAGSTTAHVAADDARRSRASCSRSFTAAVESPTRRAISACGSLASRWTSARDLAVLPVQLSDWNVHRDDRHGHRIIIGRMASFQEHNSDRQQPGRGDSAGLARQRVSRALRSGARGGGSFPIVLVSRRPCSTHIDLEGVLAPEIWPILGAHFELPDLTPNHPRLRRLRGADAPAGGCAALARAHARASSRWSRTGSTLPRRARSSSRGCARWGRCSSSPTRSTSSRAAGAGAGRAQPVRQPLRAGRGRH